jgi:hypothetical protein
LWHLKALFESAPKSDTSQVFPKTFWIFSDMMNETQDFPMPTLIAIGPEQMLEHREGEWADPDEWLEDLHLRSVPERPHTSGLDHCQEILDLVVRGSRC